jgi:lambda repressor-like predicted transcriptional regulator
VCRRRSIRRQGTCLEKTLARLLRAAAALDSTSAKKQKLRGLIREALHEKGVSVRQLSVQLGLDPPNMSKLLTGRRSDLKHLEELVTFLGLTN